MTYTLPVETINAVIQYLAQRPYAEVVVLIAELQKAKPIEEKPDAAQD